MPAPGQRDFPAQYPVPAGEGVRVGVKVQREIRGGGRPALEKGTGEKGGLRVYIF